MYVGLFRLYVQVHVLEYSLMQRFCIFGVVALSNMKKVFASFEGLTVLNFCFARLKTAFDCAQLARAVPAPCGNRWHIKPTMLRLNTFIVP